MRIPISRGLEIQSGVGLTRLRLLVNRSALCPSVIYDSGRPAAGIYGEEFLRKFRLILAAVSAGVMAVAVPPVAAQASDSPIVISAHSDYDNDAYDTLVVSARSGSDITSITAHIVDSSSHDEIASTSAFTLRSGTATDGVWVGVPLVLDKLGFYAVDVEVTDAAGHHVRQESIGSLNYAVATYFDNVALNRAAATYENRSVKVKGKLLGRYPGTREIVPVRGAYLVVYGFANYGEATTRADGTFTAEVPIAYESESLQAIFNCGQRRPDLLDIRHVPGHHQGPTGSRGCRGRPEEGRPRPDRDGSGPSHMAGRRRLGADAERHRVRPRMQPT